MKSSNYKKTLFPGDFFNFFEFTRERLKVSKRIWHHSMCFWIMHIVSKFQIFIRIVTVVNRKSKNQNLKNGEKGRVFSDFLDFLAACIITTVNVCWIIQLECISGCNFHSWLIKGWNRSTYQWEELIPMFRAFFQQWPAWRRKKPARQWCPERFSRPIPEEDRRPVVSALTSSYTEWK